MRKISGESEMGTSARFPSRTRPSSLDPGTPDITLRDDARRVSRWRTTSRRPTRLRPRAALRRVLAHDGQAQLAPVHPRRRAPRVRRRAERAEHRENHRERRVPRGPVVDRERERGRERAGGGGGQREGAGHDGVVVGYLTGCEGDDEKTTMRARAPPAEPRNPPPVAWVSRRRHAPRERWRTTSRRPTQILNPTARGARGGVASPRESREAPRDGKDTSTIRRATLESILRDGAQERGKTESPCLEGHDGHPCRRAWAKGREGWTHPAEQEVSTPTPACTYDVTARRRRGRC